MLAHAVLFLLACGGIPSTARADSPPSQQIWHAQVSMLRDSTQPALSFVAGQELSFLPAGPPADGDASAQALQNDPSSLPWGNERTLQLSCSGWGDSVEAAERNALTRMGVIQDARSRVLTSWLSLRPEAQRGPHPLYLMGLIDDGASEQALMETTSEVYTTIMSTRPMMPILAGGGNLTVLEPGPRQVRYTPSAHLSEQCGRDLPTYTLATAMSSGAAYDTAVTQLCTVFATHAEFRLYDELSQASEETALELLRQRLMTRDLCWLDCLQNAVLEPEPVSP